MGVGRPEWSPCIWQRGREARRRRDEGRALLPLIAAARPAGDTVARASAPPLAALPARGLHPFCRLGPGRGAVDRNQCCAGEGGLTGRGAASRREALRPTMVIQHRRRWSFKGPAGE